MPHFHLPYGFDSVTMYLSKRDLEMAGTDYVAESDDWLGWEWEWNVPVDRRTLRAYLLRDFVVKYMTGCIKDGIDPDSGRSRAPYDYVATKPRHGLRYVRGIV